MGQHIEIMFIHWLGPESSPRRGGIALQHWKMTNAKLAYGAMRQHHDTLLDIENYYFDSICDALMGKMMIFKD